MQSSAVSRAARLLLASAVRFAGVAPKGSLLDEIQAALVADMTVPEEEEGSLAADVAMIAVIIAGLLITMKRKGEYQRHLAHLRVPCGELRVFPGALKMMEAMSRQTVVSSCLGALETAELSTFLRALVA